MSERQVLIFGTSHTKEDCTVTSRSTTAVGAFAELYPAEGFAEGRKHSRQTVQFGTVRYRRCVTVGVDSLGLWFRMQPHSTRFRPLFIPWDRIKRTQETRLYSRVAAQLSIEGLSAVTIAVYRELFEDMSSYLALGL